MMPSDVQPRLTKVSIMGDVGNIKLQEQLIWWIKRNVNETISLDQLHATIGKCNMDQRLESVCWEIKSVD